MGEQQCLNVTLALAWSDHISHIRCDVIAVCVSLAKSTMKLCLRSIPKHGVVVGNNLCLGDAPQHQMLPTFDVSNISQIPAKAPVHVAEVVQASACDQVLQKHF